MELILLVACFVVTIFIGWSLLNLIFFKSQPFCFPERLCLSYGLGMGAVTLQMFGFYFLGIRLDILNLLLPWIPAAIAGFFIIRPKSPPVDRGAREAFSLFEKFLFAGISLEVILAFARALLKPLESFDSIATYAIRSKAIYLSGEIAGNFFSEITRHFPNADYPLLIPLAEVWVYKFLGALNDLLVKAVFPMYFLSILVIFFFLLKRFFSRKKALLFTFLLATIPQFNRFAAIGYADFVLAYYYSLSLMLIYLWMREGDGRILALSGIFSALAIWTKNEGMALCLVSLILLGLFLMKNFKKANVRQVLIFALIIILLSGPWIALKVSMRLDNQILQFGRMNLKRFTDIFTHPGRIGLILYEFQKQFFGPKKWNILWILFFVFLVAKFRDSFSHEQKYSTLSILLIFIFYGGIFLLIPVENPLQWHLGTTVSRLLVHFTPVVVFWLALMSRQKDSIA